MRRGAAGDLLARRCAACDADPDAGARHAFDEKCWGLHGTVASALAQGSHAIRVW